MKKSKIQSLQALRQRARAWRRQGKRIVFTNGCFDILHAGHVTYLSKAKREGDILVVGLNSDASVRRLKGKSRPVQQENDRALILSSLESVDYVTIFNDDTPLRLIRALKPHILIKGADWPRAEIIGAREMASWNGRVKRISLVGGRSTTSILKKAARTLCRLGASPEQSPTPIESGAARAK